MLKEKKRFTQSQTEVIKKMILTYKQQIEEKAQYIHPMHFWDRDGYANGCKERMIVQQVKMASFNQLLAAKVKAISIAQQETLEVRKELAAAKDTI